MVHFADGDGPEPGEIIVDSTPRHAHPSLEQYRSWRNAIWLSALSRGLPDPQSIELVVVTVADLAGIWHVTPQCVRDGLTSARLDQAEIEKAKRDG